MVELTLRKGCFLWLTVELLGANFAVATPRLPLRLAPTPALDSLCSEQFSKKIETYLERPDLASAHWGIVFQALESDQPLYSRNGEKLFVPASNLKLLTTAAALASFGPDYRYKTPLYSLGKPPVLEHVRLVAQGDPSLTSQTLEVIARELREAGVIQIKQLILEDPLTPTGDRRLSWEWDDLTYGYAPGVNRAILNQNQVQLSLSPQSLGQPLQVSWSDLIAGQQWYVINRTKTVAKPQNQLKISQPQGRNQLWLTGDMAPGQPPDLTTLAIPQPRDYFLHVWRQTLTKAEIQVDSLLLNPANASLHAENPWQAIASPPLGEMIKTVNQESNNLYAESLLNKLSEAFPEDPWQALNLPQSQHLRDGSGLSRQNLLSPQTLVNVLIKMQKTPSYRESLAIAGVTGTLKSRFLSTDLVGKVQGKTGTLTGVAGLSGYLATPGQNSLAFSILVNNAHTKPTQLREAMDQIILWASQAQECR